MFNTILVSTMEFRNICSGSWLRFHIAAVVLLSVTQTLLSESNKTKEEKASHNKPPRTEKEMRTDLYIYQIIPDAIDSPPKYELDMTWIGGFKPDFGNMLPAENLTEPPHLISWPGNITLAQEERDTYFTFMLVDLDFPSVNDTHESEFIHWHFVNNHGYLIEKMDTIVTYLPPKPLNGTGKHRYVAAVYKQPDKLEFDEPIINETDYEDTWRTHWSMRGFAKKYKLGDPYAINFFRCIHTEPKK